MLASAEEFRFLDTVLNSALVELKTFILRLKKELDIWHYFKDLTKNHNPDTHK